MNKSYKIEVYPNLAQRIQFSKTAGSCRFLYNKMLDERIRVYDQLKDDKDALKAYQYKTEKEWKAEFPFLAQASSRALQQSRRDLDTAYKNFFAKRAGFPQFKSKKKSKESYREPQVSHCIEVKGKKIKLLKLGWVKLSHLPKTFKGVIKAATVSKTKTGKYFVSVLTEQEPEIMERVGNGVIGLDLGIKDYCVTSDGAMVEPITATLQGLEKKTKGIHKKIARQIKGSQRREVSKLKLNQVYEKMTALSVFFFWHLAKKLCSENQAISLESLTLKNMKKNRKLSHALHLLGWGNFLGRLKHKARDYGTELAFADKFYASSKLCHRCQNKKQELSLSERVYCCEECGYSQQRDINAALNLRDLITSSESGENRHGEMVRPVKLQFNFAGSFVEVSTKEHCHI